MFFTVLNRKECYDHYYLNARPSASDLESIMLTWKLVLLSSLRCTLEGRQGRMPDYEEVADMMTSLESLARPLGMLSPGFLFTSNLNRL